MAANSKIEWTDSSWSPIRAKLKVSKDIERMLPKVGWHCEHVSPGCENCYSDKFNRRLGTGLPFKPGHRKDIEIFLDEKMLLAPLKWKRPRKIFVCSMTDLFADFVPDEWIDKLFAVMALCPQHTFQVLTKRSKRMREYITDSRTPLIARECCKVLLHHAKLLKPLMEAEEDLWPVKSIGDIDMPDDVTMNVWPLANVWLGVSCEDQTRADERIPDLLATPAAEPLLGAIDFEPYLSKHWKAEDGSNPANNKLDWIIAGGESGPNARPMHPDWARSIRDQCAAAGTAFFFKQWGEFREWDHNGVYQEVEHDSETAQAILADAYRPSLLSLDGHHIKFGADQKNQVMRLMERIGKKRAGRMLDGATHDQFPEVK